MREIVLSSVRNIVYLREKGATIKTVDCERMFIMNS
jgi:hypothetical protein